jgi:hypothetical protein
MALALVDGALLLHRRSLESQAVAEADRLKGVVAGLGLTDLVVASEARYTRHPAISDGVVPVMDHPGALEHFPSGSFWAGPPPRP